MADNFYLCILSLLVTNDVLISGIFSDVNDFKSMIPSESH